ncbi:caffeic acid 3-O-methyltransferase [Tanacetum coccineum]
MVQWEWSFTSVAATEHVGSSHVKNQGECESLNCFLGYLFIGTVSVIVPEINASHVTTEIYESSDHDAITGPELKPVHVTRLGLTDSVMEGGVTFDNIYKARSDEYPTLDARFNAIFNKAMVDGTTIVMKEVFERYHGFKNMKNMVYVGGGLRVNLNMIVSKHPAIKGIDFDQPHVIQHPPIYPGFTYKGETRATGDKKEDLEVNLKYLQDELRETEERYSSHITTLQEELQAQESNKKELVQVKESFQTLNNELESSRKRMRDLEQELGLSENKVTQLEYELTRSSSRNTELEFELKSVLEKSTDHEERANSSHQRSIELEDIIPSLSSKSENDTHLPHQESHQC